MDEYYTLIKKLPEPFRTELSGLNAQIAPFVQEIRLRAGQPVMFTMKGKLSPCIKYLPRLAIASVCRRSLSRPASWLFAATPPMRMRRNCPRGSLPFPEAAVWGWQGQRVPPALQW